MTSKAKQKATRKYNEAHYERISLVVRKGMKNMISECAKNKNLSINSYIIDLIEKDMLCFKKKETLAQRMFSDDFEIFKSNMCHFLKEKGDLSFLQCCITENIVSELFEKKCYKESLYSLAMVDYISKKNNIPILNDYDKYRHCRLEKKIWPKSACLSDLICNDNYYKKRTLENALPDFLKYNIVEGDIYNAV